MIEITNIEISGWQAAIRGMRNPFNSWDKSDSHICYGGSNFTDCRTSATVCPRFKDKLDVNGDWNGDFFCIGENDVKLMTTLANAGNDHGKFMRMITVTMDINAPLYWWKEMDQYKVGTVTDSCSTMHTIASKEFTLDDFSHDKLTEGNIKVLEAYIGILNAQRGFYNATKEKVFWLQMIQLLPSSYNQLRTVQLNYQVLKNIYHARKDHRLDEWHRFCDVIAQMPYAKELIIGKEKENV